MDKYTAQFKYPCPVHSAAPYAAEWAGATPESNPELFDVKRIVVVGDRVFVKTPRRQAGLRGRMAGGKWEEIKLPSARLFGDVVGCFLKNQVDLKPASFNGGPRIDKTN